MRKKCLPPGHVPATDPALVFHPLCALLGVALACRREARDWSPYELAARARVSRQTVSDIEAGKTGFSMTIFLRLCEEIGVPFSAVVADAEELLLWQTVDAAAHTAGKTSGKQD